MFENLYDELKQYIRDGNYEKVKEIISIDKDLLNKVSALGSNLRIAARYNQYEICKLLIENGIDIDLVGGVSHDSAIVAATFSGNFDIVRLLMQNGAKLDVSNTRNNPLFVAISGRNVEIAKYLIDAGIDIYATYKIGEIENCDACEWAKKWGTKDVYDYLIEKETADAKLFEVTASTSFESLCKIVKDTKDLYNAGERIICTAKGRRQLIEANAKGVSFSLVQ